MPPRISVVIVNWNNWEETAGCIQQLNQTNYPREQIEIIVVDNGSSDHSPEELAKISGIQFLPQASNLGFAGGSNLGIRLALKKYSDYILILNNDTILPIDFLNPLVESLEGNQSIGIVTPKINYADHPETIWFAGGKFHSPRIFGSMVGMDEKDVGQWDTPMEIDFAVGCCMLVRREVFEKVGDLDERFFFYLEDVDFCYRVSQAGYIIYYQPDSVIYHKVAQSTKDNIPGRVFLHTQARMMFLFKNIKGMAVFPSITLEGFRILRFCLSYLVRGEWDLLSAYLRGNFDGARSGIKKRQVSGSDPGLTTSVEHSPWKRNWPLIRRILTIILLISVLTYLGIKGFAGLKEIYQSGIKFHPEYLVASFFCQLVGVLLAALVWSHILKRLEVNSNYLFDLKAFCISALAKKVPGMIVYAVSRLVMYSTIQASKVRVTLAMVIEMAMIAMAGLLVFAISAGGTILPASWNFQGPVVTVVVIGLVLLACLAAPAVIHLMVRLTQGKSNPVSDQSSLRINFTTSLVWLLGEIGVVVLAGGVGYFLVKSIELPDAIPYSSILRAFSLSVALGPLSVWLPGDIGLRDGIMFLALKPYTSAAIAALITLIYRFWLSMLEITFGLVAGVAFKKGK